MRTLLKGLVGASWGRYGGGEDGGYPLGLLGLSMKRPEESGLDRIGEELPSAAWKGDP
jgi:hypothetical protein